MIQTLALSVNLREEFQKKASGSDEEMCGIMVGTSRNFSGTVSEIRIVGNIAKYKAVGFMMDPIDFLDAVEDTSLYSDEHAYDFLGIIHSHIYDKPYPSIVDWSAAVEHGLYQGPYIIYSVFYNKFNGFYWNGNEFHKMELI